MVPVDGGKYQLQRSQLGCACESVDAFPGHDATRKVQRSHAKFFQVRESGVQGYHGKKGVKRKCEVEDAHLVGEEWHDPQDRTRDGFGATRSAADGEGSCVALSALKPLYRKLVVIRESSMSELESEVGP